jgi:hypothetical protein
MIKYTDIGQFREVIRQVKHDTDYKGKNEDGSPIYLHNVPYPTLKFRGTVKLHGTNSSIAKYKDRYEFQSRERILSLTSDNSGFMLAMKGKNYEKLFDGINFDDHCVIYGEWCGGSIQKGVAINGLPKMFVIFAVKIDNIYQDMFFYQNLKIEDQQIYNTLQFQHYFINIDFENPQMVQNDLIEMTQSVEAECPVGKYFGKIGVGEGIVWEHINRDTRHIFKVKGEKHQSSHIKTLVTVDTEEIKHIQEFVDYAVTENRLKQGIDKLIELGKPVDVKSTGDYLRWVYNDVVKEEEDTIVKNGIDVKKLGKEISNKAKVFWLNYLNSDLMKV